FCGCMDVDAATSSLWSGGMRCFTSIWSEGICCFSTRLDGPRAEHDTATRRRWRGWVSLGGCLLLWCLVTPAVALEGTPAGRGPEPRTGESSGPPAETKTAPALSDWHYGGFIDLGAAIDFNFPDNHLFRSRGTTPRANGLDLNMAGVYLRK